MKKWVVAATHRELLMEVTKCSQLTKHVNRSGLTNNVLNSPFFTNCICIWNKSAFLNVWIKGMITKWMLVLSVLPLCCHSRQSIFSSFLCIFVSICTIQIVCYIAFSIRFVFAAVFSHGMSTWWLVVLSLLPLHRHTDQPKLSLVRNHACHKCKE